MLRFRLRAPTGASPPFPSADLLLTTGPAPLIVTVGFGRSLMVSFGRDPLAVEESGPEGGESLVGLAGS